MSTSTLVHSGDVFSGLGLDETTEDTEWHTAFGITPDWGRSPVPKLTSDYKHRAFVRLGSAGAQPAALSDASDSTGWTGSNASGYPYMYSQSLTVEEPSLGSSVVNFVTMTIRARKTSALELCCLRPYLVVSDVGYEHPSTGTWNHETQAPSYGGNYSYLTTSFATYSWVWALDSAGNQWTPASIAAAHWGALMWFPWQGGGSSSGYVTEVTLVVDYSATGGGGSSRMRLRAFPSRIY